MALAAHPCRQGEMWPRQLGSLARPLQRFVHSTSKFVRWHCPQYSPLFTILWAKTGLPVGIPLLIIWVDSYNVTVRLTARDSTPALCIPARVHSTWG